MLIGPRRVILSRPALVVAGSSLSAVTWTDTYVKAGTPAPAIEETCDIGTAASDRIIVVATALYAAADSANADYTCKINNNAATEAVYNRSTRYAQSVHYLLVTTGTTATVEIDGYSNGWVDAFVVHVGYFTGSATATGATGVEQNFAAGNRGAQTVTVPSNGVSVMVGHSDENGATTHAWTNATEWGVETDSGNVSCWGSAAYATTSASVTLTCNNFNSSGWVSADFTP